MGGSDSRLFRSLRRFVPGSDPARQQKGGRETAPAEGAGNKPERRTGDVLQAEQVEKLRAAVSEGQEIIAMAWRDVATRLQVVRRHCDGRCADGVREELLQAIALHQQLLNQTTRLLAAVSELLGREPPTDRRGPDRR